MCSRAAILCRGTEGSFRLLRLTIFALKTRAPLASFHASAVHVVPLLPPMSRRYLWFRAAVARSIRLGVRSHAREAVRSVSFAIHPAPRHHHAVGRRGASARERAYEGKEKVCGVGSVFDPRKLLCARRE